ncbi:2973_t:CDS:2, partial [Paraglomus occultum]
RKFYTLIIVLFAIFTDLYFLLFILSLVKLTFLGEDVKLPYTPRRGGLGGTKYMGTEGDRIGTYEGINLSSPDICLRVQTIQKLVEKIYEARVLLVRSPPMSGKTSLGQLLDQHLVKDPNIRVIRISLLWMGIPSGSWTFDERFQRLMGITWEQFQDECDHIRTILIVDEVQMICVPEVEGQPSSNAHHNGNVFWEVFKRCQQGGNLYIVAFAAYGYKGAWDCSSATRTIDVSPLTIPPENTWGIEDVRFTKDEYEDYRLRFCRTHLGKMKDENDIAYLKEYVHSTTACHSGLVAFFMNPY